jgi:hypothetical protein
MVSMHTQVLKLCMNVTGNTLNKIPVSAQPCVSEFNPLPMLR